MAQERKLSITITWRERVDVELSSIKKHLLVDKVLYLYSLITTFIIYLLSYFVDSNIAYSFITYLKTMGVALYITGISLSIYYYLYLILNKEKYILKNFFAKIRNFVFPVGRIISIFISLLALNLIFSNHTFLKSLIPEINPFKWDMIFSEVDKFIHFGFYPWEITHAIFSSPLSSLAINFAYNIWFFFMWGLLIFFIVYKNKPQLRQQFLLCFSLSWMIIGVFFATIFSSAGPCFLELITGNNQYAPLMIKLTNQNQFLMDMQIGKLWALPTQQHLWKEYMTHANSIGSGISAMPSMHVSIAIIMALSVYRINKKIGFFAYAYAILILIGSVHLGWHYAIDGYVSIFLTIALWKLIGYLVKKDKIIKI
ncbi:phosphatase PAP2 family protein [Vibrio mytili]|uniref:phosphatase PAP2 family protein n=1 Tax=Vibrio mytili TaxID=50718 RepID=UPI003C6EAE9D